jgi:ABC-type cobalt transport system substrate-binding protein
MEKKTYYVIFACADNYFKKEEKKYTNLDKAFAVVINKIKETYNNRDFGGSDETIEDVIEGFKKEYAERDWAYEFYINHEGEEFFIGLCDGKDNAKECREELSELRLDRFDIR